MTQIAEPISDHMLHLLNVEQRNCNKAVIDRRLRPRLIPGKLL